MLQEKKRSKVLSMLVVCLLIATLSGTAGYMAGASGFFGALKTETTAKSSASAEQEQATADEAGDGVVTVQLEQTKPEAEPVAEQKKISVCIDAGHGGMDGGANIPDGNGDFVRLEKKDNLALALEVQKALEAKDITVVMTRVDDTRVSLDDRCKIANDAGVNYFISLHRNSSPGANGVEVWKSMNASAESALLADNVMAGLDAVGVSRNRGVSVGSQGHNGDYKVLRDTKACSILIEMGFIDSDDDNANFDGLAKEYAESIAQAVVDTYNEMHGEK